VNASFPFMSIDALKEACAEQKQYACRATAVEVSDNVIGVMERSGIPALNTKAARLLVAWLTVNAHLQVLRGSVDPRVLRFFGSWTRFSREMLGMPTAQRSNVPHQLRRAVEALCATDLPLPPHGNYSRLLVCETYMPQVTSEHSIRFVVGFGILPDYASLFIKRAPEEFGGAS